MFNIQLQFYMILYWLEHTFSTYIWKQKEYVHVPKTIVKQPNFK